MRVKTCERRTRTDTFQMEQKLFSILHPPPKSSEVSIISPDKKKGKSSNLAKEGRVREKKLKPQLQVITTFRSQHGEMI